MPLRTICPEIVPQSLLTQRSADSALSPWVLSQGARDAWLASSCSRHGLIQDSEWVSLCGLRMLHGQSIVLGARCILGMAWHGMATTFFQLLQFAAS